jgi:hypothetical protein
MKTSRILGAAILSTTLLLALVPSAKATTYPDFQFNVTLAVGSLSSNPNQPFSIDFQLAPGSDNVPNSVTLSNFSYVGGAASGTPDYAYGSETGLPVPGGTVVLTNANPLDNEIAEAFTPGTQYISFHVDETPNSEEVGSGTPIPDQFNVAILDNSLANIPTTDPSGGNTLLSSALGSTATLSAVNTYTSIGADPGVFVVLSAPEPNSGVLSLLAAGVAFTLLRLRRQRAA